GEGGHLDVAPAARGVHLAGVDVQLPVAPGLEELLGQPVALAALLAGARPPPPAGPAGGGRPPPPARPPRPARPAPSGEGRGARQASHAARAGGQPAVQAQQAVGGELGLPAALAVAMRACDADRPEGGHHLPLAAALEADRAGARAEACGPPFSSEASTRPWTACCRAR